jgi:hypothetical protein
MAPMSTDHQKEQNRPSLASDERERLWGAKGSGELCSHCHKAIEPEEAQLELVRSDGSSLLQFHVPCYDDWRAKSTLGKKNAGG